MVDGGGGSSWSSSASHGSPNSGLPQGGSAPVGDRLIIRFDPGGPIELTGISDSFAALARIYERHISSSEEKAPKLYITKLTSGSIIAEIAPIAMVFGVPAYQLVTASVTIANFSKRISDAILAFAGFAQPDRLKSSSFPNDDASDIREFVKPLTGRKGAQLGIRHARYSKTNGQCETVLEYQFTEDEINRASLNIERMLQEELVPVMSQTSSDMLKEVMLVFDSASRAVGREQGRTTDKTIITAVSDKPLPTYFRQSVQGNLKDRMVRGDVNPLTDVAYIVDVHVQYKDSAPRAYLVTELHAVVPLSN